MSNALRRWRAWWRQLRDVVRHHRTDMATVHRRLDALERLIRERTTVAVDVNPRGPHTVIVVGHYRDRDYIQTFSVDGEHFEHLIDTLRQQQRTGYVTTIDAVPSLRAVIERELQ